MKFSQLCLCLLAAVGVFILAAVIALAFFQATRDMAIMIGVLSGGMSLLAMMMVFDFINPTPPPDEPPPAPVIALPPPPVVATPPGDWMAPIAILALIAGIVLIAQGLMMDVSVPTDHGVRVHNLALADERMMFLVAGGFALVIATILGVASAVRPAPPAPGAPLTPQERAQLEELLKRNQ